MSRYGLSWPLYIVFLIRYAYYFVLAYISQWPTRRRLNNITLDTIIKSHLGVGLSEKFETVDDLIKALEEED